VRVKLVAGLGNPGDRYRGTRHNAGFEVVDLLARAERVPFDAGDRDRAALTARWRRDGEVVLLAKPLTFMNRSGAAVDQLLAQEGGTPPGLVVVLDDAALDLGTLRVRERGSHGSHNGLRSVIEAIGTDEFPRVRVGVRKGEPPDHLAEYVLSEFPQEDVLVVQEVVGWAADAVEMLIREGAPAAMNRFNPMRGT
jgi:PTH1 family peptidyl-tRNA hydrolase